MQTIFQKKKTYLKMAYIYFQNNIEASHNRKSSYIVYLWSFKINKLIICSKI